MNRHSALPGFALSLLLSATPAIAQNKLMQTHYFTLSGLQDDGAGERAGYEYDNRAFPGSAIGSAQQQGSYTSFLAVGKLPGGKKSNWQELGPFTPNVAGPATYTGRPAVTSGRLTALAVSPSCHASDCKIFVASAGGGIWEADNALAQTPNWHPSNTGIPSNAIGSIVFDPNDPQGRTLYAGTGEPSGSSDSEAGIGLYKSTDFGKSWTVVPGSVSVARDRGIGAVAIDPSNANHIFIGTTVARHGSSSANGGRFTPPGAPQIGLYESTDGGATFALAFSQPADAVVPSSANGTDFFRGGITTIKFDGSRIYLAMMDYGVFRSKTGGGYEQVFASAGSGSSANSSFSRTEFALARLPNGKLRIYVGDAGGGPANFYRTDDGDAPVPSWIKLSSSVEGTPGFASYNFCGGQCTYDMVVASPPGQPDVVWIGGQMQYDEIFTSHPPSNGRAVQRSTDAGVHFTDMTNDTQSPPVGLHPDQHAIGFAGTNPDIAFLASDGGIVRVSGSYSDASADCDNRGITGTELTDCRMWLKSIPTQIISMNAGLATMQFQSVSVNPQNARNDIIGGTQDNGTWAYNGKGAGSWFESVGGDGGFSGIHPTSPLIRMHTYTGGVGDVNFRGNDPLGWNWTGDPLLASGEAASFYAPLISDPSIGGTWFVGLQRVWRTRDNGGAQAYLELHCNEFFGDFTVQCGDWERLGGPTLTGSSFGTDKSGSYVVALQRAASDSKTLWAATRRGRLFVSRNADAVSASAVTFTRIDTASQPARFISGIAVDGANANHAFVSFSGYDAYTPSEPGHVFEVTYPATGPAVWINLSYNLGDQPITGIVRDDRTGDLFVSTDFGVAMLKNGATSWQPAAGSLPPVAVYGLTIDSNSRILYAASHGRGIWSLDLSK